MPSPPADSKTPDRLDVFLTKSGAFESRARARDAIARGVVSVNGIIAAKPGMKCHSDDTIEVTDPGRSYVSRAALKLIAGLDHFGFDPEGRDAVDVGASTGGFSQVLLERGARHVTALDVGHGQLHSSLADDPRIENLEGLNARRLTPEMLGGRDVQVIVSDVSFISLKLALPPALSLAGAGCFCVLLVKPQFEAGRKAIGKGGVIRDVALSREIAQDLSGWLDGQDGWSSQGFCPSPITGADGNHEFLLGGTKS